MLRVGLLAALLALAPVLPEASAQTLPAAPPTALPPKPALVGPVKRGADGRIETAPLPEDPTCAKGALCVGKSRHFKSVAAALEFARVGTVVAVDAGTYRESVKIVQRGVTIRGVGGRPHFACAEVPLVDRKGCLVVEAQDVTIENLEISDPRISKADGNNGACVRVITDGGRFTLRNVVCRGAQIGILTWGGSYLIEDSEISGSEMHNIYFNSCETLTVRRSKVSGARIGHEIKSRCGRTEIIDSTVVSSGGSRNIDIPDGGEFLLRGGLLQKEPSRQNPDIFGYAPEHCLHPGKAVLQDVTIVNSHPNGTIRNYGKCPSTVELSHIRYSGTPVKLSGNVLNR